MMFWWLFNFATDVFAEECAKRGDIYHIMRAWDVLVGEEVGEKALPCHAGASGLPDLNPPAAFASIRRHWLCPDTPRSAREIERIGKAVARDVEAYHYRRALWDVLRAKGGDCVETVDVLAHVARSADACPAYRRLSLRFTTEEKLADLSRYAVERAWATEACMAAFAPRPERALEPDYRVIVPLEHKSAIEMIEHCFARLYAPNDERDAQLAEVLDDALGQVESEVETGECKLDNEQLDAIRAICKGPPVSVLEGRPGSGKSTTLRVLMGRKEVGVVAPTGVASTNVRGKTIAKFMREALSKGMRDPGKLRVIRRLCESFPMQFGRLRGACEEWAAIHKKQEDCDGEEEEEEESVADETDPVVVMLDEFSMVSLQDFAVFMACAVELCEARKIVLVGDANQIPPVVPGECMNSIMACHPAVSVNSLTVDHRTDAESQDLRDLASMILDKTLSHEWINRRKCMYHDRVRARKRAREEGASDLEPVDGPAKFLTSKGLGADQVDGVLGTLREEDLYDPREPDSVVLAYTNKIVSRANLVACEAVLGKEARRALDQFVNNWSDRNLSWIRPGARVMCTQNTEVKPAAARGMREAGTRRPLAHSVCNGTLVQVEGVAGFLEGRKGWVRDRDLEDATGVVSPGAKRVLLGANGKAIHSSITPFDTLKPGWALTGHSAQGAQFRRPVVLITRMMDKRILYTAITRASKSVVVVGDPDLIVRIARSEAPMRPSYLALSIRAALVKARRDE